MEITKSFVAVDPGLSGTGYAFFPQKGNFPLAWGNLYSKAKSKENKAWEIVSQFQQIHRETYREHSNYRFATLAIEEPKFFETGKGLASARKDSFKKLTFFYGYFIARFNGQVVNIDITKWKGQMSKKVTAERVYKVLPKLRGHVSTHAIDAIGIGLYCRGLL